MKRNKLHALNPESAWKRIKTAKSNESFMAALLNRDHRGHKDAVDQWTRLHRAAHPEKSPGDSGVIKPGRPDTPSAGELGHLQRRIQIADSGIDDWLADRAREAAESRIGRAERPPVINMSADRIRILQDNAPALFEIVDDGSADPNYGVWRSIHPAGANAVQRHVATIEREATRQGVDPDWVKAIMYVENAQGYYGVPFQALGVVETLFPMNINPELWSALSDPPADLNDPVMNIRNAVTLIRRITERVDEPTLAKVASIWIFAGAEQVSDHGARVQDVYANRRWEVPVVRRGQMRRTTRE